ncbi:unnamed protein product, partial [Effrenium voratum]
CFSRSMATMTTNSLSRNTSTVRTGCSQILGIRMRALTRAWPRHSVSRPTKARRT